MSMWKYSLWNKEMGTSPPPSSALQTYTQSLLHVYGLKQPMYCFKVKDQNQTTKSSWLVTFSNVHQDQRGPEWGTSNFLSISSRHASILPEANFLFARLLEVWGVFLLGGGYLLLFWGVCCFCFESGSHCVVLAGLELSEIWMLFPSSAKSQSQKSSRRKQY